MPLSRKTRNGDDDDDSDENAGELLMPENGRSNSSTRIVRRILMDYMSRRQPVDQWKFIVTAFAIDIYSYLDKRLDVDVTLEYLTYI
jgi:hypothetical protein